MELYKERGVNPASGCLPILLQLPLLLIVYQVISQGLTNPDPTAMLTVFGVQVVDVQCVNGLGTPAYDPYEPCIDTTVAWLGNMDVSKPQVLFAAAPDRRASASSPSSRPVLQLVQSRMTMPPADPAYQDQNSKMQRQLVLFLPLISILYGGFLPAGLFIYWIVTTIFGIAQQYLIVGWGSMFPILGWTPGFAKDHRPRFPVEPPDAPVRRRPARRSRASPPNHAPPRAPRPTAPHPRRPPCARANEAARAAEGESADTMSEYREFTGKSVEEALRSAREAFGVGLDELDFEILTPGSRGVLGMGAEPARIVAAPRSALGGEAPKRAAAEATPLPARPPRDDRPAPTDRPRRPRPRAATTAPAPTTARATTGRPRDDRPPRRDDRPPRRPAPAPRRPRRRARPARPTGAAAPPSRRPRRRWSRSPARSRASARSSRPPRRRRRRSPPARRSSSSSWSTSGFDVEVVVETGETNRLNVVGADDEEHEALGALIGRKGERLSALQHIVNLMLSRQMGEWTRVLVDVEGYRGRREQQLREIALRAAEQGRRDRQDAPARADAGPRAALGPPRAARATRPSAPSRSARSRTGGSWSSRARAEPHDAEAGRAGRRAAPARPSRRCC